MPISTRGPKSTASRKATALRIVKASLTRLEALADKVRTTKNPDTAQKLYWAEAHNSPNGTHRAAFQRAAHDISSPAPLYDFETGRAILLTLLDKAVRAQTVALASLSR